MAERLRCQGLILGERAGSITAALLGASRLVQPGEELTEQVAQPSLSVAGQVGPEGERIRRWGGRRARGGAEAGVVSRMRLLRLAAHVAGTSAPVRATQLPRW